MSFLEVLNSLKICKSKYAYLIDDKGEPYDIVSNKGLKKIEKTYVERNGEYRGFCVEAQEDISPIITNHHIKKALEAIKNKDLLKASTTLSIYDQHMLYGDDVLYFVIDEWLKANKIKTLFSDSLKSFTPIDPLIKAKLIEYVKTERNDPIRGKIKIVDIGANTKTKEPVVPADWINRCFLTLETNFIGQWINSHLEKESLLCVIVVFIQTQLKETLYGKKAT